MRNSPVIAASLAVLAAVCLWGCGRTPATSGTVTEKTPLEVTARLRKLHGAEIRVEAETLEALIGKVKPLAVFGGRDMIWADEDGFMFDRAFYYQPKGEPGRWVLLEKCRGLRFRSEHVRARAKFMDAKPMHDSGSGDYAVVRSRSPDGKTLYEVGWMAGPGAGSGAHVVERRIFMLRERSGRWRLVGEGPSEGSGNKGAFAGSHKSVRLRVTWTGAPGAPVRIRATKTVRDWATRDSRKDLRTLQDGVLEGPLPAEYRRVGRPHVKSEKDESLAALAHRIAVWNGYYAGRNAKEKASIEKLWLDALRELNPDLPETGIPEGTRVDVLRPSERMVRMNALLYGPSE